MQKRGISGGDEGERSELECDIYSAILSRMSSKLLVRSLSMYLIHVVKFQYDYKLQ